MGAAHGGRIDIHRDILFIEKSVGVSGSTMSLCTLLAHLDPERYRAHVVVSRPEQLAYLRRYIHDVLLVAEARSLRTAGLEPATSTSRSRGGQLARISGWLNAVLETVRVTVPYALRLYGVGRTRRISLVHQNNGFDVGAFIAARLLRAPMVAFQRGDEWNSFLVRSLARHVEHYVANSETTKTNLMSLGVPANRVTVVYPAVDFSKFDCDRRSRLTREQMGLDPASRCVGIIGLLAEWKGHRVFLRAMQRVIQALPSARALVVGDVHAENPGYRRELEQLARELNIARQVRFMGFRDDIADILQVLDIVVHASVLPEPFGRVIVEAMAMKKPVIATRAGGPTEIIDDGRTGILVPPGDPALLGAKILELLSDRHRARDLAEAGYRVAKTRFSVPEHLRGVERVYDSLARRDRRVREVFSASQS